MKTFFSALPLFFLAAAFIEAKPARDDEEPADSPTLQRIMEDVRLVRVLNDATPKAEMLPKFSAKKLAEYGIDPKVTAAAEKQRHGANKAKYGAAFPLRAALFDAGAEMEAVKISPRLFLAAPIDAKKKALFFREQQPLATAIFQLDQAYTAMKEADKERTKEKSKRWQLAFDLAMARVESSLLFLFEYDYLLGQIRADSLPALTDKHDGWRLTFKPKINVTEGKAKQVAKERLKRLEKIQQDHAETPWAYFAERESQRNLGMEWVARKK